LWAEQNSGEFSICFGFSFPPRLGVWPLMNILLCSVPFWPSVGGIESVSAILAEQFHAQGHRVVVVTQTAAAATHVQPYQVVRRPGAWQLMQLVRAADVVFHNNISLRLAWPLLWHHKPWVVAHHTWIPSTGRGAWAGHLKRRVLRWASNIACSQAVARSLPVPCAVVPNAYLHTCFRELAEVPRNLDIVCLARLVSDKGVALLLQALALLRARGLTPNTTIIGDGPEAPALQAQATTLGLTRSVRFAGQQSGDELVRLLNAHRVAVVPSMWEEPFGLVALEVQACGCIPVVARSGGLPEAAGPRAVIFAKGDSESLANCLATILRAADRPLRADTAAQQHLQAHRPERVAAAYLEVLQRARGPDDSAPAAV
jgi:glycogen synthase